MPFRDVYFTGIIRDKQGRKMSKSLGNSPDPLDIIAKYGADGLRFGLMRIAPQGQDIRFDEQQIVEGRNFCNKFWNACRFRLMQGPGGRHRGPSETRVRVFSPATCCSGLMRPCSVLKKPSASYRFQRVWHRRSYDLCLG